MCVVSADPDGQRREISVRPSRERAGSFSCERRLARLGLVSRFRLTLGHPVEFGGTVIATFPEFL